jgi:PhnB protein
MIMKINPYLVMNGNAREAIAFYEQALGAQLVGLMTFGDAPDPTGMVPESAKNLVMHAHLRVGESDLMFSDTFPGQTVQSGNQVSIAIHTSSKEESERIFAALAEAGQVEMPLQETDWSPAYGSLRDKFGVHFQINTEAKQQ